MQLYEYPAMADRLDQQNPRGFLQYAFDNAAFNFNIHTIDTMKAMLYFAASEVFNASYPPVTQTL